jgi:hypothetical protein
MTWIARPPDEHPDPDAPMWRAELALVRECIPEALTPEHMRELRAREARLCLLLGEPMTEPARLAEGATCPACREGTMDLPPHPDCYCHTSPPCDYCTESALACPECGWRSGDDLEVSNV